MSSYETFETWEEMIDYLKDVPPPQCFAVNYKPNEEKYALWIGNQPYDFYDETIEKLEFEAREMKKVKTKYDINQIASVGDVISMLSLLRHRVNIPYGKTGIPTERNLDDAITNGFKFMKWL